MKRLFVLLPFLLALGPAGCSSAGPSAALSGGGLVPLQEVESAGAPTPVSPAGAAPAAGARPGAGEAASPSVSTPTAELPSAEPALAPVPSAPGAPSAPPAAAFAAVPPPRDWAAAELARRGFTRDPARRAVVIDPGHGGPEVGSAQGRLAEKNVNLKIAQILRDLLEADGIQVVLTREEDDRAYTVAAEQRSDEPGTYERPAQSLNARSTLRADLQARVDLANAARADLFISIHNNGSSNPAEAGTEVWYAPDRPFGDRNLLLAQKVLEGLLQELRWAGYDSPDRGLRNGSQFRVFQGRTFPLFVLGGPREGPNPSRATLMPGILGETLFLSNVREAALLAREDVLQAIARGYRRGILGYFAEVPR